MPDDSSLKILPLGGLGEIGKNMLLVEHGNDAVLIDAGVQFPDHYQPGVDLVVPDFRFLGSKKYATKLRGLLITHGHEDHIGAIPYLLKTCNVPIYAPGIAREFIARRLKEHKLKTTELHLVVDGTQIEFGQLSAEWFTVCHSLPDSMGIKLKTNYGNVVHTGDFKVDHNPKLGLPTDLMRWSELFLDSPFLLLSDSTYSERDGYSGSDSTVEHGLHDIIAGAEGRVLITSFASQIARMQMVMDSATALGKRVVLVGRGMGRMQKIAKRLNHIEDTANVCTLAAAQKMPADEVVILVTGSQAEPASILNRISRGTYPDLHIRRGDLVVMSSSVIPGNETEVQQMLNRLTMLGAQVVTNSTCNPTHVRGHAHQDELRMLLNLAQPQYFVPVHGEYRMLAAHAQLAMEQGVPAENVFVITDGQQLELNDEGASVTTLFPADRSLHVQYGELLPHDNRALTERKKIARAGLVSVVIMGRPDDDYADMRTHINCVGLPNAAKIKQIVQETLNISFEDAANRGVDWEGGKDLFRRSLERSIHKATQAKPVIICDVIEIQR